MERIRKSGEAERVGSQLFIIDADEERTKCWDLGVKVTPAFVFYWQGKALVVKRLMHDDDIKLTGSFSEETLVEVIKTARENGVKGIRQFCVNC
mmetsp:Transcript_12947/g.32601  ORF Transcript_12947/g.32601 Transcript_12947/m.32601 type:complete len:94 (+) Transcript_12947:106-387(+)